jgi:hypothetical protein
MIQESINIFSDDIRVYEYALDQIPNRQFANKASYARNDSFEHALRIVENLFKRVEEVIYIKSSLFCKKFYLNDRILNVLNQLKDRNIKIKILIEQKNFNKLIGQEEVLNKFEEIFKKQNVTNNYIKKDKQLKINDFILIDEYDFRYELDNPKLDNACKDDVILNTKASACFNAHKDEINRAKQLKKAFNYLSQ